MAGKIIWISLIGLFILAGLYFLLEWNGVDVDFSIQKETKRAVLNRGPVFREKITGAHSHRITPKEHSSPVFPFTSIA